MPRRLAGWAAGQQGDGVDGGRLICLLRVPPRRRRNISSKRRRRNTATRLAGRLVGTFHRHGSFGGRGAQYFNVHGISARVSLRLQGVADGLDKRRRRGCGT